MTLLPGLLQREPPDGKEKPEPPKQQQQQQQQQQHLLLAGQPLQEPLSRKNSKCDLVDRVGGDGTSLLGVGEPLPSRSSGHHLLKAETAGGHSGGHQHLLKAEAGHHLAVKRESLAGGKEGMVGSVAAAFLDPAAMGGQGEEDVAADRLKDW